MMFLIEFLVFCVSVVLLAYLWSRHAHNYWKRHKIPFLSPTLLFGNIKKISLFQISAAQGLQEMHNSEIAQNEPVVGIYLCYTPALLIRDLEIVKKILVRDFHSFGNRYSSIDPHTDALGYHNLFFVKQPEWKEIRTNITPVFTSGKIKQMFSLVSEIGKELDSFLCSMKLDPETNSVCTEIKDICSLYTTDVIASVAYGIKANSLENPNGEFRTAGRKLFYFNLKRAVEFMLMFFQPKIGKLFGSRLFSAENTTFLNSAISSAIETREKSNVKRNDLIDVLVGLKKAAKKNDVTFHDDMLIAQAAIFFTAGYETSSSAMSFALFELCRNMECQKRLRNEIKKVLTDGELTYDAVLNMEYLNMVFMEIVRLYPALPFLDRECTAPNGYSLEPEIDFVIPKGMPVYISSYALHHDPKYFPDPEKFDPERFSPANKNNISPYSYMPFGHGPHNCIGERFGVLQTKIGLINFFKNHYIAPSSKTHETMKLNTKALIIQSEGGIHCKIVRDPLFC